MLQTHVAKLMRQDERQGGFAALLFREQSVEQRTAEVDIAAAEREHVCRRLIEDDELVLERLRLQMRRQLVQQFLENALRRCRRLQLAFALQDLLMDGL